MTALTALAGGVLGPIAPSQPYLGSPANTPVTMRMRPAQDVELLQMMQSVGDALAVDTTFAQGWTSFGGCSRFSNSS